MGILVRGKYDDLEKSYFESQDAALQQTAIDEVGDLAWLRGVFFKVLRCARRLTCMRPPPLAGGQRGERFFRRQPEPGGGEQAADAVRDMNG